MTRFLIQVTLVVVVLAFAWRSGGKPERCVAAVYFCVVFAGIGHWLVTGSWGEEDYDGLQLFRFVIDAAALVAIAFVAISHDRWWTLWVGSAQLLAVTAHLLRAANMPLEPFVYAIMERWPVWLALIITGLGTLSYRRRRATANTT